MLSRPRRPDGGDLQGDNILDNSALQRPISLQLADSGINGAKARPYCLAPGTAI
jgi:hypothetical protein